MAAGDLSGEGLTPPHPPPQFSAAYLTRWAKTLNSQAYVTPPACDKNTFGPQTPLQKIKKTKAADHLAQANRGLSRAQGLNGQNQPRGSCTTHGRGSACDIGHGGAKHRGGRGGGGSDLVLYTHQRAEVLSLSSPVKMAAHRKVGKVGTGGAFRGCSDKIQTGRQRLLFWSSL